nr:extracellular solute-binding protein [Maliibacterium massiliense]
MKRRRTIRVIAGVLVCLLAIGLPFFGRAPKPERPHAPTQSPPDWVGVLTLHVLPGADVGAGSRARWLQRRAQEFEQANPGVFIEVRTLTSTQCGLYYGAQAMDPPAAELVAFSTGTLEQAPFLQPLGVLPDTLPTALAQSGVTGGVTVGVPYMRAGYALLINKAAWNAAQVPDAQSWSAAQMDEALQKLGQVNLSGRKKDGNLIPLVASADTWDNGASALALRLGSASLQTPVVVKTAREAWELFYTQKAAAIVATPYVLYRMRALYNAEKGFETLAMPLAGDGPVLADQVHYIGLTSRAQGQAQQAARRFISFLLEEEQQQKSVQVGMLPAVDAFADLYPDNPAMACLQASQQGALCVPGAFVWAKKRTQSGALAAAAAGGDAEAKRALRALFGGP